MKKLFSAAPYYQEEVIGVLRMVVGALLIYHGKEVFDSELMKGYVQWDQFKDPSRSLLPYLGKSAEFIAGVSLLLGLATRIGALITMGTFCYITFLLGGGKFWYEDQHPFMFFLFGILFLFAGPGKWSVDSKIGK